MAVGTGRPPGVADDEDALRYQPVQGHEGDHLRDAVLPGHREVV